jgi:long-chain fatty acid transport protein
MPPPARWAPAKDSRAGEIDQERIGMRHANVARSIVGSIPAAAAVGVAAVISPQVVHASGFALLEQSASRLGTAFAGTTTAADDATANYFNPAGLTQLTQPEAVVIASGVLIESEFNDQASQSALLQSLGNEGGDAGGWNFVPSAYVAAPIGAGLAVGFGVNAPFGLVTDYDAGWLGRFQALKSEIVTMNFNPSLAWRVNERVSLGVGVSYQRLNAELTNSVNYSALVAEGVQQLVAAGQLDPALAPGVIAANAGLEGRARVRGHDGAWGFNVGALFEFGEALRVGFGYRSALDYTVRGAINFAAPTVANPIGAGIVGLASAPGGPVSTGPVSVDIELPSSAILSVQQGFGQRFTLLADVGWTDWSSIVELRVVRDTGATASLTPEHWEDAYRFALGGEYALSNMLTLRAGLAHDESAVPDATRTPRLPDVDRTWIAIGARFRPQDALVMDFGYAHLFSDDARLNQSAESIAQSGFIIGEQESAVDVVSAQFIYRF